MFRPKSLLVAGVIGLTAAAAFAQATNPAVVARQDAMKVIGAQLKVLGDMAKGSTEFDAEAANAALALMAETAAEVPALFEAEETDPESKALPAIWENFDDFTSKAEALEMAAANATITDAASIGAAMGGIGGSCQGCHMTYRSR